MAGFKGTRGRQKADIHKQTITSVQSSQLMIFNWRIKCNSRVSQVEDTTSLLFQSSQKCLSAPSVCFLFSLLLFQPLPLPHGSTGGRNSNVGFQGTDCLQKKTSFTNIFFWGGEIHADVKPIFSLLLLNARRQRYLLSLQGGLPAPSEDGSFWEEINAEFHSFQISWPV